jgi:hypothetical protein
MATAPLSPEEIRAAAQVHRELGPEYSDAVVESFLERVDQQISERIDARLARQVPSRKRAAAHPQREADPAEREQRRSLTKGIAIGTVVTGVPLTWLALVMNNKFAGGLAGEVLVVWLAIAAVYITCVITSRRQSGRQ